MQASGSLAEADILELLRFPCPGVGIGRTSFGMGLMMVKEFDLKLTLGIAEMRNTESSSDKESWGGGQLSESLSDSKSPSLGVTAVSCPISHTTSCSYHGR